ncbi:MAG: Uncharacterized protein G01um101456_88 [Parcubacteria group bacterium Gr01-1014_56]|nr:MAG: Uncharacterized protein G01um101456_88 [Parcubacteria group bacterium Gr01-1014_56]
MLSRSSSLGDVVGYVIGIIDMVIPVLVALALVLILYSSVRYVIKAQESHGKGAEREAIMWGLIALFVIVSVWGILRLMCSTLFDNTSCRAGSHPVLGALDSPLIAGIPPRR